MQYPDGHEKNLFFKTLPIGNLLQLLSNPYRAENYFNDHKVYEIPDVQDQFEIEITPSFGVEEIILCASTNPLGPISIHKTGPVYAVKSSYKDLPILSRGIVLKLNQKKSESAAEFFEGRVVLNTSAGADD